MGRVTITRELPQTNEERKAWHEQRGLCVVKVDGKWNVTHTRSGFRIGHEYDTRAEAKAELAVMLDFGNWERTSGAILRDRAMKRRCLQWLRQPPTERGEREE